MQAQGRSSAALVVTLPILLGMQAAGEGGGTGTAASHAADPALEVRRALPAAATEAPYDPMYAAFSLEVGGEPVPYETMAVFVVAGAGLDVRVQDAGSVRQGGGYRLVHATGRAREHTPGRWRWTAPDRATITALQVEELGTGRLIHLNAFVLHPRSSVRNEALFGYRIGRYRETPLAGNPLYLPPAGFAEVRPADHDILVSPHFTVGQFLCKQPGNPQYLALTPALLRKLEAILEATNQAGYRTPTLAVMSGFRTPAYNRSIGNTTDYSRHLWGDAADIYVDVDGDGDMDDLNKDGRRDLADARVLSGIVGRLMASAPAPADRGGLALYRRNAAHGPFVHVDARGTAARW